MKQRLIILVLLVLLLGLFTTGFASAAGIPVGSCPSDFHLHTMGQHHEGHMHMHIGNSYDQNGDGLVCAKHVTPDGSIAVHVDNRVR